MREEEEEEKGARNGSRRLRRGGCISGQTAILRGPEEREREKRKGEERKREDRERESVCSTTRKPARALPVTFWSKASCRCRHAPGSIVACARIGGLSTSAQAAAGTHLARQPSAPRRCCALIWLKLRVPTSGRSESCALVQVKEVCGPVVWFCGDGAVRGEKLRQGRQREVV